jgi:hypothetical protein
MAMNGTVAMVTDYPACDFAECDQPARFDGRTSQGPWAFMCLDHWSWYGPGKLGIGYGQKLALSPR